MKRVLSLILAFTSLEQSIAQSNSVNINKLVSLTEKSNFKEFTRFTSQLSYKVLDSTKDKSGSIFYFTKEPVFHGNILACSTDTTRQKISQLTFTTFNKEYYVDFKEQLRKSGFTSSRLNKSAELPIIESQDFEKGKILVATATRKDDNEVTTYEFTFIKW